MTDRTPRPDGLFFRAWSRIPRLLFGGRVRTTTLLLIIVLVGSAILYGNRSEHYSNLDREAKLNDVADIRSSLTTTTPEIEVQEPSQSLTSVDHSTSASDQPDASESGAEDRQVSEGLRVPELSTTSDIPTPPVTTTAPAR
ncbi:hypothetical protein [Williamsia sp. 1138]|uniref:hypothetical protein n=1 Tax=Williamsia sp. 1138 TaxID=1903117 RepID=UPI00117C3BA3|nr:hypothetical protein [Williamsia sp. 1138]